MATYIPGKWIHKVYGVAMLAIVIAVFLPAMMAKKEMKQFCEGLAPGASINDIRVQAEANSYDVSAPVEGHASIEDAGNYGPQKCDVRFGPNGLLTAKYIFNE